MSTVQSVKVASCAFLSACAKPLTCPVSLTNAHIRPRHEEGACVVRTSCVAPPDYVIDCGSSTCSHTTGTDDGIGLVHLKIEVSY